MQHLYKPEGYNSASPYLIVNGAQKLIDMLSNVFNATVKRRYERPDGSIMHVEAQIDDTVIMLSDATEKYPAYEFWMHIYVPDVDETYQKAMDYGCESEGAPMHKNEDPDKRGNFKDFAGNHWSVATQIVLV